MKRYILPRQKVHTIRQISTYYFQDYYILSGQLIHTFQKNTICSFGRRCLINPQ